MTPLEKIKNKFPLDWDAGDVSVLLEEIDRLMRLEDSAEELVTVWAQKDICGRLRKAEAQLKDIEYRWQCERERVMKAKAEIKRWQKKKWEIEEKYNQLFTEYKRRGKTIIRLDNRNKKVEDVLKAFKSGINCEARDRELMLEAQLKDCAIKIKELEEAAK